VAVGTPFNGSLPSQGLNCSFAGTDFIGRPETRGSQFEALDRRWNHPIPGSRFQIQIYSDRIVASSRGTVGQISFEPLPFRSYSFTLVGVLKLSTSHLILDVR
jgi:hypothetical protein